MEEGNDAFPELVDELRPAGSGLAEVLLVSVVLVVASIIAEELLLV